MQSTKVCEPLLIYTSQSIWSICHSFKHASYNSIYCRTINANQNLTISSMLRKYGPSSDNYKPRKKRQKHIPFDKTEDIGHNQSDSTPPARPSSAFDQDPRMSRGCGESYQFSESINAAYEEGPSAKSPDLESQQRATSQNIYDSYRGTQVGAFDGTVQQEQLFSGQQEMFQEEENSDPSQHQLLQGQQQLYQGQHQMFSGQQHSFSGQHQSFAGLANYNQSPINTISHEHYAPMYSFAPREANPL